MKKKTRTNVISIIIFAVIIILFYILSPEFRGKLAEYGVYDAFEETKTYELADSALMHVIDVGQGDSILLQNGNSNVLIDAGPNSAEDSLISYLRSVGVDRLDCLVLTHPHEDHIGGADLVLNTFDTDTVLMPDYTAASRAFENVLDAVENNGLSVAVPQKGDKFTVGDLSFTVLAPENDDYEETNDFSIVMKVEYKNTAFMLTGDAEKISENEILDSFDAGFLKCDVLKAGHHGSSTSNSKDFVSAVDPKFAAVSCELDNDYGHPHKEVRTLFDELGIEWYRTDYDGTVVFVSNGESVTVK